MNIQKFQEIYRIHTSKANEVDKSIRMVCAVTGLMPDRVEAMKIVRFNKICRKINSRFSIFDDNLLNSKPKKFIYANGRLYRLNYDIAKITAGKYVEASTFSGDPVENLHKLLATIAEPVFGKRSHEDKAEDMLRADFSTCYHSCVFFYALFSQSMDAIRPYLERETKGRAKELLGGFYSISGGFTLPKWLASSREYLSHRFGI